MQIIGISSRFHKNLTCQINCMEKIEIQYRFYKG